MEIEDLEKLIRGRRSIRKWKKEEVPDDLLRHAVELATWAPNGGNYQGWYFTVVKNRDIITRISQACLSAVDEISAWPEAKSFEAQMGRSRFLSANIASAPACIGVFTARYESHFDRIAAARGEDNEDAKRLMAYRRSAPTALLSAAAAVMNMLLSLHAMGLGAVWLALPILAKKKVESILEAPKNSDLVCIVAVGYPDESPQKSRKPVDQVMRFIR